MNVGVQPICRVHLWVYNHPFHGIADQVEFFLMTMRQRGYDVTISRQPSPNALNVVIENFSEATSATLIDFCRSTRKRVAVIMTEHIDFFENQIYIHGEPLWSSNDYMHPVTQVGRIKNLIDCIENIRCFFVLGDLPRLHDFTTMLPGHSVRRLAFPTLDRVILPSHPPHFEALFTGAVTAYRAELLRKLEPEVSTHCPHKFVSRRARDKLNTESRLILNLPQRQSWRWISLMRVIAGLRCGRASVSLGTQDDSQITVCCPQIDLAASHWVDLLKDRLANWREAYTNAYEAYIAMTHRFAADNPFPHDLFEYWALTEAVPYQWNAGHPIEPSESATQLQVN